MKSIVLWWFSGWVREGAFDSKAAFPHKIDKRFGKRGERERGDNRFSKRLLPSHKFT